jgi:hypothetical protein
VDEFQAAPEKKEEAKAEISPAKQTTGQKVRSQLMSD